MVRPQSVWIFSPCTLGCLSPIWSPGNTQCGPPCFPTTRHFSTEPISIKTYLVVRVIHEIITTKSLKIWIYFRIYFQLLSSSGRKTLDPSNDCSTAKVLEVVVVFEEFLELIFLRELFHFRLELRVTPFISLFLFYLGSFSLLISSRTQDRVHEPSSLVFAEDFVVVVSLVAAVMICHDLFICHFKASTLKQLPYFFLAWASGNRSRSRCWDQMSIPRRI